MLNNRLWVGLREYGWVARGLVAIGIVLSVYLIAETIDWFQDHAADPLYAMAVGSDSLVWRFASDAYESLSEGSLNWISLVLLEVVTYHFMRRTLQIVLRKNVANAHEFKPFLAAQKRMIVISVLGLTAQSALTGMVGSALPFGLSSIFSVAVQSTILGYAIADNYNEQFDLTVRQSIRYLWRNYIGVCAGLGLPLFLMLKVPVIGTVMGPLVTAVTAGIVLRELSDLHIVGYQLSEKERVKQEKKEAKRKRKEAR